MHVSQEVLSVSTRKSINICELEPHRFIYEPICDKRYIYIYMYVCIYIYIYKVVSNVCIHRGSNCERSQGHKHM